MHAAVIYAYHVISLPHAGWQKHMPYVFFYMHAFINALRHYYKTSLSSDLVIVNDV